MWWKWKPSSLDGTQRARLGFLRFGAVKGLVRVLKSRTVGKEICLVEHRHLFFAGAYMGITQERCRGDGCSLSNRTWLCSEHHWPFQLIPQQTRGVLLSPRVIRICCRPVSRNSVASWSSCNQNMAQYHYIKKIVKSACNIEFFHLDHF